MSAKTIFNIFGIFMIMFIMMIFAKVKTEDDALAVRVKANDPVVRVQVR